MTAGHDHVVEELCADLDAAVRAAGPTVPLVPADTDLGDLAPEQVDDLLGGLLAGVDLVADRARIDATLDVLPPELRALAIRATFEDLYTP